jgi:hypothetical protein
MPGEEIVTPQETYFKRIFRQRWVKVTAISIVGFLLLFIAGFAGYLYGQGKEESVPVTTKVQEETESKESDASQDTGDTLDTEALQDTEATSDVDIKGPISAYMKDDNVFILNSGGGDTQVTFDGSSVISRTPVYGNPHPTSKSLTYSKCIDKRTKESLYTCEIIIYNLGTKEKSKLKVPKSDSRFALIGDFVIPYRISKDEKSAVYILPGDKGKVAIKLLDTVSKNGKKIYQYDNYVTVTHSQLDDSRYFRFSPDDKSFFLVTTYGFPHAIIFNKDGKVIKNFGKRDLTHGGWVSDNEVVFSDRKNKNIISYNISTKKEKVISSDYPWFNPLISPDGKTIASWKTVTSTVSNTPTGEKGPNHVNVTSFYSIDGKKIKDKNNFRIISWIKSNSALGVEIKFNNFSLTGYTPWYIQTLIDL